MKIALIIVRILMGLLFLFASITYFFKLITPPELTGAMKTFCTGMEASVYMMPTVKAIELFCGLAFVAGLFVRLAAILISPIIINIILVHVFLSPEQLPFGIALVLANLFVIYCHRESYKPLFKM